MKWKTIMLLTGIVLPFSSAIAQYTQDALKFSQSEQGVTARFRAMGSAQTSLGGDLSSLASNPAGLGLFTKNEINFTADFSNSMANSSYLGNSTSVQKDKLGLNQLAAVFHFTPPRPRGADLNTGWVGFNFGIGYNKTSNYNVDVSYGGTNSKSSFADYLSDLANAYLRNGNPGSNTNALPAGSLEKMAYNNFLIEYDPAGYFPTTQLKTATSTSAAVTNKQQNTTLYTGTQSEVNIGGGANYGNKLYLGASISLSKLSFGSDREFAENGKIKSYSGQPTDFIGSSYALSFRSTQGTDGSGVNAKFGAIYRAAPNVRIGLNFISPTWYMIDDVYSEVLDTRYTRANGTLLPYLNDEELYESKYNLRTPYKVNGGISVIVGGQGLITGDVEYIDYSMIHFSSDDQETTDNTNRDIVRNYKSAVNLRVGGEVKLSSIMLRAGYNTSGNPYKNRDYSSNIISGGLGYRKNNFYTDFTYTNSTVKYTSRPYLISQDYIDYSFTGSGESATIDDKRNNFYLTFGLRF